MEKTTNKLAWTLVVLFGAIIIIMGMRACENKTQAAHAEQIEQTQTKLDKIDAGLSKNKAAQIDAKRPIDSVVLHGGKTALKGLKTIKPMPKVILPEVEEQGKFIVNYKAE